MQLFLKLYFNMTAKKKISIDKWTIMDSLNGVLNIVSFLLIMATSAADLSDTNSKIKLDYMMIVVLVFGWLRFFAYFLVIRQISMMLLTIYEMLADTISFMFVVLCYFVVVTSVFTTLFQDINPNKFGSLPLTARVLFDASNDVYDYLGMGN